MCTQALLVGSGLRANVFDDFVAGHDNEAVTVESIKSAGFQSNRKGNISAAALHKILNRAVPAVPDIHPKNLHIAIFISLPKCIFYTLTLRDTSASRTAKEINKHDFA